MATKACAACGKEVDTARLLLSDKGHICDICNVDEELPPPPGLLTPILFIGFIAGILPCFLSFRQSSLTRVNGELVQGWSINYIALAGGATALVVALIMGVQGLRAANKRPARLAIAAVILLFGMVQLLRGFIPFF